MVCEGFASSLNREHDHVRRQSEEPVDVLIATCVDARRTGRKADFESIVEENPQFEPEIADFLDDYDQVESKFAPLRELLSSEAGGAGEVPTLGPRHDDFAGAEGRQLVWRL